MRGHRARMVIKTEERGERNFGKRRKQGRGAQVWIRGAWCPSMVLRASHSSLLKKTVYHKVKIKKSKDSSKHKNQRNIKPERNR